MKKRPNRKQRNEIRAAQFETRALRQNLEKGKKLHPLQIAKIISDAEDKARSNPFGSKFYRKIYPTKPMNSAEIKKALK